MKKTTYITTSIPYVNGSPHIGFALEMVQADTLARTHRKAGNDTYFMAGTDENAIKNVETAEKLGMSTQELVDQLAERFLSLRETLNLSFDSFIRTSSKKHHDGAQKFWELCRKDMYKKSYEGLYCVGCETFYKDGEFPENICPEHNRKLEIVSETNYFFNLTNYLPQIKELIQSGKLAVYPEFRRNELMGMIDNDLGDFSISRPTERTKGWGIPVPGDDSQRIYVWFDALTNYITGLDYAEDGPLYKRYWEGGNNRIHVIGKNIIKFHAIYWIGMLLSAGLPIPHTIYAHGFINSDGVKMSKSLGNVVDPHQLVSQYGTDAVRYYLLREIPALDDGNFSKKRFLKLYNADLANNLGNLVSRVVKLCEKNGVTPSKKTGPLTQALKKNGFFTLAESYQFHTALELFMKELTGINQQINIDEPWAKEQEEAKKLLAGYTQNVRSAAEALSPFLPHTSARILEVLDGSALESPLFPRISETV